MSLPYKISLTRVFDYFEILFTDKTDRFSLSASNTYDFNSLKRMDYKLNDAKVWIPKHGIIGVVEMQDEIDAHPENRNAPTEDNKIQHTLLALKLQNGSLLKMHSTV